MPHLIAEARSIGVYGAMQGVSDASICHLHIFPKLQNELFGRQSHSIATFIKVLGSRRASKLTRKSAAVDEHEDRANCDICGAIDHNADDCPDQQGMY